MSAEISQLRAELESTRAVAARLAALLRTRPGAARCTRAVTEQPGQLPAGCQASGTGSGRGCDDDRQREGSVNERQAHPHEPGGSERGAAAGFSGGKSECRRAAPARGAARAGRRDRGPAAARGRGRSSPGGRRTRELLSRLPQASGTTLERAGDLPPAALGAGRGVEARQRDVRRVRLHRAPAGRAGGQGGQAATVLREAGATRRTSCLPRSSRCAGTPGSPRLTPRPLTRRWRSTAST